MIGSHYFESGGEIHVGIGKGALGKYPEEDIHTPLREINAAESLMEDETVGAICLSKRGDYSATTSYLHGKEHHKDFHPRTDLRDSAATLPKAHQQIFSDPCD